MINNKSYLAGADPVLPMGGGANPSGWGRQYINLPDFSKNGMKLRKIWSVEGHALGCSL